MEHKVYLYSRVSTDQQSLAQQERAVYEWLAHRNMNVSDVVSDEGISGGVSYKDRKLGRELLPKMKAGDMLIVSEISRLGRSMFDLSKLIHEELKPRNIRLVVVGMGIDLRCDNLTAMDELILNNFSFAAQLEKQLISERTKSALCVKRTQGIKLGAASEKYKANKARKSLEQLKDEGMKHGEMKRQRFQQRKQTKVFLKVLKKVLPDHCEDENPALWEWTGLDTKCGRRIQMLQLMKDFHEFDETGKLFSNFDFNDLASRKNALTLCSMLQSVRTSYIGR